MGSFVQGYSSVQPEVRSVRPPILADSYTHTELPKPELVVQAHTRGNKSYLD